MSRRSCRLLAGTGAYRTRARNYPTSGCFRVALLALGLLLQGAGRAFYHLPASASLDDDRHMTAFRAFRVQMVMAYWAFAAGLQRPSSGLVAKCECAPM